MGDILLNLFKYPYSVFPYSVFIVFGTFYISFIFLVRSVLCMFEMFPLTLLKKELRPISVSMVKLNE